MFKAFIKTDNMVKRWAEFFERHHGTLFDVDGEYDARQDASCVVLLDKYNDAPSEKTIVSPQNVIPRLEFGEII